MRALVLSGGGEKGAYQAGAIKHLLGDLRIRYDILAGVSVGALNAAFAAQFMEGEETEAGGDIVKLWRSIRNKHVRKSRFGGLASAVWAPGVYNSAPLRRLISGALNQPRIQKTGKRLRVLACDLRSGDVHTWDEHSDDLVDGIMASSAFPVLLPWVRARDGIYVDGGVRDVTPLGAAIDAGATVCDVITLEAPTLEPWKTLNPSAIEVVPRAFELMFFELVEGDLKIAQMYNALARAGLAPAGKTEVAIRVLRPLVKLGDEPLNFVRDAIVRDIEQGYRDAVRWTAEW